MIAPIQINFRDATGRVTIATGRWEGETCAFVAYHSSPNGEGGTWRVNDTCPPTTEWLFETPHYDAALHYAVGLSYVLVAERLSGDDQ